MHTRLLPVVGVLVGGEDGGAVALLPLVQRVRVRQQRADRGAAAAGRQRRNHQSLQHLDMVRVPACQRRVKGLQSVGN